MQRKQILFLLAILALLISSLPAVTLADTSASPESSAPLAAGPVQQAPGAPAEQKVGSQPPIYPVQVNLADLVGSQSTGVTSAPPYRYRASDAVVADLTAQALAMGPSANVQSSGSGHAPDPFGVSFDGIDESECCGGAGHVTPPDSDLAAGPNHLIAAVNLSIEVYNKTGTSLTGPVPLASFFGPLGGGCASDPFDPTVIYDEEADRWIIGADGAGTTFCEAVSQTGNPVGAWNLYGVPAQPVGGEFHDYPHQGVGDSYIVVGANQFDGAIPGGFEGRVWALDKAIMYAGGGLPVVTASTGNTGGTPQPLHLHGWNQGTWPAYGSTHYFITDPYDGCTTNIWQWNIPNPPSIIATTDLCAATGVAGGFPVDAPQMGGSAIQANDWRMRGFEYRNGHAWSTDTIACNVGGTVDCVRWHEYNMTAGAALVQAGVYGTSGEFRIFPDLAVNDCNDMAVGYNVLTSQTYPSIYVNGRLSIDPPGTLQAETLLKAGEVTFASFDPPPYRWGDYASTTIDPDGVTFWQMGEYSKDIATISNWGNWIGSWIYPSCGQNEPPNINVNPLSLTSTQQPNSTTTQTLNVGNTGDDPLTWTIAEASAALVQNPDGGAAPRPPAAGATGSRGGATGGPAPIVYTSPADFSQGFDDITVLAGQGWFFQNNSSPLGVRDWFQGNAAVFPAQAGAPTAYIGANYNNTGDLGTISNWMLTPEIALANGDTISFWTRQPTASAYADRLQVRLSTAGPSTNVGTLATDVGVFTTLLLDINPTLAVGVYPDVWTQYTATLSGIPAGATGRIAWRYFVTDAGLFGTNSDYTGIDTVEFTSATPPGPCDAPSDVPWLSEVPTSGTTTGGGSTPVQVTFDSTGLALGTYNANLCVSSNDPDPGPSNGTKLVIVPVELTVLAEPPISLLKTVGTTPDVCATTSSIEVAAGTTVYYCYTVTNTGDITLNLHDLDDDVLGNLFTGLNYALTPGSSVNTVAAGLSFPYVANASTTNVATWTAYNPQGQSATATATATVTVADIELVKTVGTTPGVCAPSSSIEVPAGTQVFYCYTVTNTGDVTLNLHNLVDDQLGPLFMGLAYALAPGASVNTVAAGLTYSAVIDATTTNVATWTAYNQGGPSVTATATATVNVPYLDVAIELIKTVGTTPGVCAPTNNINVTPGTTVYYCYTIINVGDATLDLHDLVDNQLGTLFTDYPLVLAPGSSVSTVDEGLVFSAVINAPTTNVATWTAYDPQGRSATSTATATVTVNPPTAVTLAGLSATPAPLATGLPLAALPAAVSLALGAAYALRRRGK